MQTFRRFRLYPRQRAEYHFGSSIAKAMTENDPGKMQADSAGDNKAVNLSERFARSARFTALFSDGMALVEETATYLDENGRREAKTLGRQIAVLYGSESMRLTTRLMQLASWLLLQRAVSNGEMTRQQLLEEKRKIPLESLPASDIGPGWEELPQLFLDLVNRSTALQKRIVILDREIYGGGPGNRGVSRNADNENPVGRQIDLLSTALGARLKT
jgi:regulator of CtrA degradation